MAARVTGQELSLGIDNTLVGAQERVDVVVVTKNPGLGIGTIALGLADGARLVLVIGDEEVGVVEEILPLVTSQADVLPVNGNDTAPGVALVVIVDDIVRVTGQLTKFRGPSHDIVPG